MNDSLLIERLASTDLYRNDRPLPDTVRPDIGLLEIARRIDMDTMERVEVIKPPRPKRNGPLIAASVFAVAVIVGLAGALLTSTTGETEPADQPTVTTAPPTTAAPVVVEASAADPIQATNDQASRVTVNFAGNARALAQGAVYAFEIEVHLEGSRENAPGATVTYSNRDGTITTTGSSPGGAEMTATWDWYAADGVLVTLRGQGISVPDTRPEVVVSVQETASSNVIEFVMDSQAP